MSEKIEASSERIPYRPSGEWGFTNDPDRIQGAKQFRDDAVADGWSIEPTYGDHEPMERAAKLCRDGYAMSVITREKTGGWQFEAKVHIWGPDRLAIDPPEFYDFAEIERRTRICGYCGATEVRTQRVGFAGRCCENCLPAMRKRIETPGWTN